jgi:hypothetical protein
MRRRTADPPLPAPLGVIILVGRFSQLRPQVGVSHDDEALSLAESRARRALGSLRNPVEGFTRDRLGREAAHHPPLFQ